MNALSYLYRFVPGFAQDGVIEVIKLNDDKLNAAIATLIAQIFQINEVKVRIV